MSGYKSDVSFLCPKCQGHATGIVDVPEPHWSEDRASDTTVENDVYISCRQCKAEFLARVQNTIGHCDISLYKYPNVKIQAGHAYFDGPDEPWIDYDIPDYPFGIFKDSYDEANLLLADRGGNEQSLVNRMIFVQQVGALEAYLGDTLINKALSNREAIVRLLESDPDLKTKKYSLAQIASDAKLVEIEVKVYLKSVIYHNIRKVRELYRTVFGFDLYVLLGETKNALFKAVEYRHDCVHRNGRDKDGNQLKIFTRQFVQEQANNMMTLATKIERERRVGNITIDEIPF